MNQLDAYEHPPRVNPRAPAKNEIWLDYSAGHYFVVRGNYNQLSRGGYSQMREAIDWARNHYTVKLVRGRWTIPKEAW